MGALFRIIWQIALLRQGPQQLPASSALLWLALAAHWLTGVIGILGIAALSPGEAMLAALVGTLAMVGVVHGLLVLHGYLSRVVQTLTAVAACEVVLGLIDIPVTAWFNMGGTLADLAILLSWLILGWNIAIIAHILRHALGVTMGVGILFAFGYTLISISLGIYLIPLEGA